MRAINLGSGQRRFDVAYGWVNVDAVSRPGEVPDVIADGRSLPFDSGSCEYVVLHQVIEHFGCGEADAVLKECWRVLKPQGSLLLFLPDIRRLAQRWLVGAITDWIFIINMMGAYHGAEGDRHKWHFTQASLTETLTASAPWCRIVLFDWRSIPGSSLAKDWWVLAMEAVK